MICIECTYPGIDQLYCKYNSEYIRLTLCPKCGRVADKYIEFDNVILSLDILLLKKQAYRHLAYNVIETEVLKDPSVHVGYTGSARLRVIDFVKRYKRLVRLVILVVLFDVYLTWAHEEKKNTHSQVMAFILEQKLLLQYSFFFLKLLLEITLFNLVIQIIFTRFLSWGTDRNRNFLPQYQRGYYASVLLTAVLVSSSIRLFPILMLIWPYDRTTISSWLIGLIGTLNTIEAIRLVTYKSYFAITSVMLLAMFTQIIVSRSAVSLVVSIASNMSLSTLITDDYMELRHQLNVFRLGLASMYLQSLNLHDA